MFRRRKQDPTLDSVRAAFGLVAARVDAAQRALLTAIPTPRDPGVPVAQALKAFRAAIDDVTSAMPGWRNERVIEQWNHCSDALKEALDQAERLRLDAGELTFEQLNARVGDVLYPLETFADTERDLRRR